MPNSTAVLTDTATLSTNAFSEASLIKAAEKGYEITGMASATRRSAAELHACLELIAAACDAGDAQLTLTNNILGTFS
jgi:hypothetical protein